jgi:hypothetical protein
MHSVDLAARFFLERIGLGASATFYTLVHPGRWIPEWAARGAELPIDYVEAHERLDEIRSSDLLLYWGDFLHAHHYHKASVKVLVQLGMAAGEAEAMELQRRHHLLEGGSDDVLASAISFGTTLIANSEKDYSDEGYARALSRFARGARRIWVRDPLSAAKIGHLTGDHSTNHLGVDCAMLSRPEDLDSLSKGAWSEEIAPGQYAGVYFGGRTDVRSEHFVPFVRRLCAIHGVKADWIPWLMRSSISKQEEGAWMHPDLRVRPASRMLGDLYAALRKYRFVVTDTYHLCLNSWRAGTPAVCVGGAESEMEKTALGNKKKDVFYSMYEASDLYVESRWLETAAESAAERIGAALGEARISRAIQERIEAHSAAIGAQLASALLGAVRPRAGA